MVQDSYTAAVLANMGPKGLIKIDGRPMIAYVLDSIPDEAEDLVITCTSDRLVDYEGVGEEYGARVIPIPSERAHIRSQLEAIFQTSKGDGLLILRCDTPLITRSLTTFLLEVITKFTAGIPRVTIDKPEYAPASYRVKPFLDTMAASPGLQMSEILRRVRNILYISSESLKIFDPKLRFLQRVNSSEDASRAAGILRAMREGQR